MATTNQIMDDLNGVIESTMKRLGKDITEALVRSSPKDTGWLSESWKPNIGGPSPEPLRPAGQVSAAKSRRLAAQAELNSYVLRAGEIVIQNFAGYAAEVDNRRPFVEDAIERVVTSLQAGGLLRVRFQR